MDAKKEAFVEALITTFGNKSAASHIIKISRQTYYDWIKNDLEFLERVQSITADDYLEIKKDFIEASLMKLIGKGNPAAVIFGCKTICKDRGYVEKQEIDFKNINVNWHEERYTNEANRETE